LFALVHDVADDLLHRVFEGDDAGGAAVFVHDDREVGAVALGVAHELLHRHRRGHEMRRPHHPPDSPFQFAARNVRQQVLGHQNARYLVHVLAVDGHPRIAVLAVQRMGFAHRGVLGDGDRVLARHENFPQLRVAEFEDALDHLALVFLDHALRLAVGQRRLELFVGDERRRAQLVEARDLEQDVGDAEERVAHGREHAVRGEDGKDDDARGPLAGLDGKHLRRDFADEND